MANIETIQQLLISAIWAVPLIVGLIEVVKKTINLTQRWVPVTAVVIGGIIGVLVISLSIAGAITGIIFGLGAIGLYEVSKTTIAGK